MKRGNRKRVASAVAGAVALLALACVGCRGEERAGTGALRWIEEPPADELRGEQLEDVDCVQRVDLADVEALRASLDQDTAILEGVGGAGVTLRGGLRAPRLRIERPFAPGEVTAARLVVAGVRRGEVRVVWSEPGKSEELGAVALRPVFGGGALRDHFMLDLAGRLPTDRPVAISIEPTS
ncbi:MAG: hypothetical protein KDB94_13840, partial [Acidobacteria bacterium]|nr:hypothetical protein [Acidobacteriota bacterium]